MPAHRISKDFVGAAGQHFWPDGVQRDIGFALRSALIGNVDVTAYRQRVGLSLWRAGAITRQILIFRPPSRVMRRLVLRAVLQGAAQTKYAQQHNPERRFHNGLLGTIWGIAGCPTSTVSTPARQG